MSCSLQYVKVFGVFVVLWFWCVVFFFSFLLKWVLIELRKVLVYVEQIWS